MAELAFNYARHQDGISRIKDQALVNSLQNYIQEVKNIIVISQQADVLFLHETQARFHKLYQDLRQEILIAATQQRFEAEMTGHIIDQIYRLDRIAKQLSKGTHMLVDLIDAVKIQPQTENTETEITETTY